MGTEKNGQGCAQHIRVAGLETVGWKISGDQRGERTPLDRLACVECNGVGSRQAGGHPILRIQEGDGKRKRHRTGKDKARRRNPTRARRGAGFPARSGIASPATERDRQR
jgi:hypothetical protein